MTAETRSSTIDDTKPSVVRPAHSQRPLLFEDNVARLAVIFLANVIAVSLVALLLPTEFPHGPASALIPLIALSTFLPAALGTAVMLIRGSRYVVPAATLAACLTTSAIAVDLLTIDHGAAKVMTVVCVGVCEVIVASISFALSPTKIFPLPLRLATLALLTKLAIVGLLAAAAVPAERNPLRLTGWLNGVPQNPVQQPAIHQNSN